MGLLQGRNETTHIKQAYPEIKEPCFVAFRKNLFDKIVVVDQIVKFLFNFFFKLLFCSFEKPINEAMPEASAYLEGLLGVKILCDTQIKEEEAIKKKALQEISLENQSRYFVYQGNNFFSYYDEFSDGQYPRPGQARAQDPEVQRKLQMDRM